MPANMKDKGIKFSVLAQEAIDWYINHDRRDLRNFKGRMKFILEAFADQVADEIKPSDLCFVLAYVVSRVEGTLTAPLSHPKTT